MRCSTSNIQLTSGVNNRYLIKVTSIAASAQFATGYQLGGVFAVYYDSTRLFTFMFMSSLLLGLCLGSFSVKYLCTRFGRRMLLIGSACVLVVGTVFVRATQCIVNNHYCSYIGRLISGIACGVGSTVAPIYSNLSAVKEITPSEVSGKYGGLNQVFLTLGYCTAFFQQYLKFSDLAVLLWWQVGYLMFIALMLMYISALVFILPDSAHWYYERGHKDKAKDLIRKIVANPAAVVERNFMIREEVRTNPESSQGILTATRKDKLVIACAVATCGFDFAANYSILLKISGSQAANILYTLSLLLIALGLNLLMVFFSHSKGHVDFYRKHVFMLGLCVISALSITHAALILTGNDSDLSHTVVVIVLIFVYESTIGPFFWIYIPEILKIKDICYPTSILWGIQLINSCTFTFIQNPGEDAILYIVLSTCSLVFAGLIYRLAVETKGVSWTEVVERLIGESYVSINEENTPHTSEYEK